MSRMLKLRFYLKQLQECQRELERLGIVPHTPRAEEWQKVCRAIYTIKDSIAREGRT